jgi:hypothetical protein
VVLTLLSEQDWQHSEFMDERRMLSMVFFLVELLALFSGAIWKDNLKKSFLMRGLWTGTF